ncbi:hypothetical protein J7T55_015422 [Diaporthe amygdali]|uniref:uncharacterized protein n=1 Tax=Phomopsis amygdali TaxID=1214568 RepID=UPI0022FEC102|nr:uncharacterized protein J7T55_015422 [Diaporthe amygdali]KAJ0120690.1 hypothetical protein J7T55_015422 [Diaporthe amygdali]
MSFVNGTNGEDLTNRLLRKLVNSAFDPEEFCPDGCVKSIITPETISRKLEAVRVFPSIEDQQDDQKRFGRLVDFISQESKTIFAIVLCCGLNKEEIRQAFAQFKNLGLDDTRLPVLEDNHQRFFFTGNDFQWPWDILRVRSFCLYQWKFLAPVFKLNGQGELALHSKHVFPFLRVNQRGDAGTFGEVYQVTIHPNHLRSAVHAPVAIKKLHRSYSEDKAKQRTLVEAWVREVSAHKDISQFNSSNIIKFMTAFTRGHERYLMFEWADGGNLREFWTTNDPILTRVLVRDVILQLHGLADALDKMHSMNYRHGDMKPENILRVNTPGQNGSSNLDVGTLKICDMGLSKNHTMATRLRDVATVTMFTTWRYEPPEAKDEDAPWPRRYDIWSIGCIILEFIVWLVDGPRGLDKFNKGIVNDFGSECHYFESENRNRVAPFRVHAAVRNMMERLSWHPECEDGTTALGDLLRVVRTRLLVVNLGSERVGEGMAGYGMTNRQVPRRADAASLKAALDNIIRKGNERSTYWLKDCTSLDREATMKCYPIVASLLTSRPWIRAGKRKYVLVQLNNIWEFTVDNNFAAKVVETATNALSFPKDKISPGLCAKCRQLEFWKPHFRIVDRWDILEDSLHTCDFCRMRYEVCKHLDRKEFPEVRFDRDQSILTLNDAYPPVMSICRGPESQINNASHIQIGCPKLPESASQTQFDILRQFLNDCDAEHPECRAQKLGSLPTRLIHLSAQGPFAIVLYDTQPEDVLDYVALSHPWGQGPYFRTTLGNVEGYRKGIDYEQLPATFRDAVITTRELGLEYLWIDSICIIQGEGGDFDQEAKRMEDVFSSAFCVIAASSACGQNDGFLNRRNSQREFLTFEPVGLPALYVGRFIDDFNKDVLQAPLSQRGWVLQERALARRTIYFTNCQTYWECGKGVRCETLTKMDNKLASFLGDPNFPSKLSNDATTRGVKIRLYEELYRQYTRLKFTRISDRPIAIAGLEKRLIRDLKAEGGFGVFDDGRSLFQRSLLWQRGREFPSLAKIPCIPSLSVPTWSWMAYDGGIDFLDLPLGGVHWFTDAIKSPWAPGSADTWHTGDGKEFVELKAWATTFTLGDASLATHDGVLIVYDSPGMITMGVEDLMCVVVGREIKKDTVRETTHFALVIKASTGPVSAKGGSKIYERIGVGYVKGKCLNLESSAQAVLIR